MKKQLKNLTIIPQSLYVKRNADRQVRQIVDDMGRPGYVLVARQMGKTNLLLNARRELSKNGDLFVYVDVSNTFPTLREFFRNIIDVAISNASFDNDLLSFFNDRRAATGRLPEHKEHEVELAAIIGNFEGKLVICLDEIDALTKTSYSDNVFSFIRSVYFSGRVNIPQFERLTYLLSGVAEPTELIKNKNISPFNIGAKIFLEDFSIDEIESLAQRTDVTIPTSAVQRIFFWTSGHPRMSWHLLSEVEDLAIGGARITEEVVDGVVRDAYLKSFDQPPVDHIRKLAEDDRDIRDAIMSMHYDRSEAITTSVRTKLYLNGVIASQKVGGNVSLRNRILEAALSEDWLRDVEYRKLSAIERAEAAFAREDYEEAAKQYTEFLDSEPSRERQVLVYARLGVCHIRMRRFEEAVGYLKKDPISIEDSLKGYLFKQFNTAVALMLAAKPEEARPIFEEVAMLSAKAPTKEYLLESMLNCAAIDAESTADKSFVIDRCNSVLAMIKEIPEDEKKTPATLKISMVAQYLIYKSHSDTKEHALAEEALAKAIEVAEGGDKISLNIMLAAVVPDEKRREFVLSKCVDLILETKPEIREASATEQFVLTEERLEALLCMLLQVGKAPLIDRLVEYLDSDSIDFAQARRVIYLAGFRQPRTFSGNELILLLQSVSSRFKRDAAKDIRRLFIQLLAISAPSIVEESAISDLESLLLDPGLLVSTAELRVSFQAIQELAKEGEAVYAQRLLSALEKQISLGAHEQSDVFAQNGAWDVLLYRLRFVIAANLGHTSTAIANAARFLERATDRMALLSHKLLRSSELEAYVSEARSFVYGQPRSPLRRQTPKIGRNDIVEVRLSSGETVKGKYKKFEEMINRGDAEIVLNSAD